MASTNEIIKLIIRTANNKYADFTIELSSLSTVYELKQKLTINHPTKPIPKDQRLIFSGKLLDDSSLLNQIFIKSTSGSSFMIHLVLSSDKNATTPKIPQTTTKTQTIPIVREQSPSFENPTIISSHSNTYEQYLEELNKYQQQFQQFLTNPNGISSMNNYENQAYLQYCYTHYQMYQNFLAYQRTVTTNSVPIQQSTMPTTVPASAPAAPPPPQPQPVPPQAAQPAAGNNNELEQENDLLGILNMLVELFVFCSIIYFYSTFSRFLVVFLIFALLYLHCRGYLSLQRRRRAQAQPPPPAAAAAPVNPEQVVVNEGEDEAETEPVVNEGQNQNDIQRAHPPSPPSGLTGDNQITTARVLLTAVTTFFSSLVPERPQRT